MVKKKRQKSNTASGASSADDDSRSPSPGKIRRRPHNRRISNPDGHLFHQLVEGQRGAGRPSSSSATPAPQEVTGTVAAGVPSTSCSSRRSRPDDELTKPPLEVSAISGSGQDRIEFKIRQRLYPGRNGTDLLASVQLVVIGERSR